MSLHEFSYSSGAFQYTKYTCVFVRVRDQSAEVLCFLRALDQWRAEVWIWDFSSLLSLPSLHSFSSAAALLFSCCSSVRRVIVFVLHYLQGNPIITCGGVLTRCRLCLPN